MTDPPDTTDVGSATDRLLATARARISTVDAAEAFRLQQAGATLVDTRPAAQRAEHGEIAGAVVVERNVLEWRLDPSGDHRLPDIDHDRPLVVFCQEGYASSLAVAVPRRPRSDRRPRPRRRLRRVESRRAADRLIRSADVRGGVRRGAAGWRSAGSAAARRLTGTTTACGLAVAR